MRQKLKEEFDGKKINILEIGVYEGRSTVWMLKNLCTHEESKLVAVDWFAGSKEYEGFVANVDMSSVEKTFMHNISVSGKQSQIIFMKDSSFNGLLKLNRDKNFMFDLIYIDGSHMPHDILADGVLSWRLLKENGIMIFDDYGWEFFEEGYNRTAIAIDAFVACHERNAEVIEKEYQAVIRKVKKERKFTITEYGMNLIRATTDPNTMSAMNFLKLTQK